MTLPQDDLSGVPDEPVHLDTAHGSAAAVGPLNSSSFIRLANTYCERAPPAAWKPLCSRLRRSWDAGATVRHHAHVNDPTKTEKFHGECVSRALAASLA